MSSIRMQSVARFVMVSVSMTVAAACAVDASDEEMQDEDKELVASDEQSLSTDGQVCITVQRGTSGQVEDATLWEAASSWNDGANERISTGTSPAGGYSRSLIRFDLSAVPAGATVVSADLGLMQVYKNGPSATVNVHQATGAWSEGDVTWDSFGGAFDPTPVGSFTAEGNGWEGTRTVDVRELAQDWVSGNASNDGVVIDAPADTTRNEFRSSESPYVAERPSLSLCYTTCEDGVQNGEETGVDCGGPYCDSCSVSGSFYYSASNTGSATYNTTNVPITLPAGATVAIGTCSLSGAYGYGDTYLRLYNAAGYQVAVNDDWCGYSSYMTYTVPPGAGGTYTIRAGCYSSGSCSGNVVYTTY